MAEKATSSSPEEAGACTPEQGKEHQELDLPVQPSSDSLSSAVVSECPACQLLLRYPQQVTCYQRRFCGECIEKLLKDGKPCPSCNEADFSALPDDSDERNKDEGVGELAASDLDEHPNSKPSPESQLDRCPQDHPPVRASKPPHPSGYDCEFVGEHPQEQYKCPICLLVLRGPQQVKCCGNSYCKVCIDRVVKDGTPCPTCNAVAFSIFPDKGLRRTLGGFRVCCSNKDEGCEWVGELGDIESHLNSKPSPERQLEGCLFEEVACVYCACLFQRQYIRDHQSNKCPKRQFQCEHCGEIDSYENITKIHLQKCPSFPIACRQHCGKNVQRQEIDNHVSRDCSMTIVDCDYQVFGCEVRPARKDLPTHINESVADHMAMLAKSVCKVEDSAKAQSNKLQDNVTELLDTVSKQQTLITSLQNENKKLKTESADAKFQNREHFDQLGRENAEHINQLKRENSVEVSAVKRENRERVNHLERENDDRINQLRRENNEKLMIIKRRHFQHVLLVLTIVAIGIGVVSHRGDVKLAAQFNNTFLLHTVLENKTHDLITQTSKLKGKLEELGGVEDDLSAKLEDVQDSFATLEVQLQTEIDRKMTDFEKNKATNAPWFSPPFYTHTHGYKICIRVDANGNGNGKGTHVSVFLVLMRGMFDNDLKWPFQGHITIELVNRLNPTSNLTKVLRFSRTSDPEIVGKVTSGDRAASGLGWHKFIAHSELDYNADKQTQYLKHDSLIFRISKVKNDLSAKLEHIQEFAKDMKGKLEDMQEIAKRNMNSWEGKWQDSFASLEVQLETEIDRKMIDFEKNKTANAEWFSPPFYTHTHGYKMCIKVYANGHGVAKGTHVSVFLYLMRGIFDDDLEWPFQGHITVELVNQLNPTSNLVREIRFSHISDPASVGKVTSGDIAATGWGLHKFIAHSELDVDYYIYKWTQYLKDDSLIFRISKVTNVK